MRTACLHCSLTFDPQSLSDGNPYWTDYIIRTYFLSKDLLQLTAFFIWSCVVLKLQVRSPYLLMQFGLLSLLFPPFCHLIMWSYLGFSCWNMSALKRYQTWYESWSHAVLLRLKCAVMQPPPRLYLPLCGLTHCAACIKLTCSILAITAYRHSMIGICKAAGRVK